MEIIILPENLTGLSTNHAWHLYVIRIIPEKWKITRNKLIEKLITKVLVLLFIIYRYTCIHIMQKSMDLNQTYFQMLNFLSETVISLPIYHS